MSVVNVSHPQAGVCVIEMNRPDVRNAVNLELAQAISNAMDDADNNPDVSVIVFTGAGKSFCTGLDLAAVLTGELPLVPGKGFGGLVKSPPRKPLIAAIEGHALAGGLELALACDLIVSSRTAKFGLPEVKRGLAAAAGGLIRLPRRIPYHHAMELALTGEYITAEQADRYGLINRLTEPGEALADAITLASTIAANAPLSTIASKQTIAESATWDNADQWRLQSDIVDPVIASNDAIEGATAFVEKRPPVWTAT